MGEFRVDAGHHTSPPRPWVLAGMRKHLKVLLIGGCFGLGAYAVIQLLILLTRRLGWLG